MKCFSDLIYSDFPVGDNKKYEFRVRAPEAEQDRQVIISVENIFTAKLLALYLMSSEGCVQAIKRMSDKDALLVSGSGGPCLGGFSFYVSVPEGDLGPRLSSIQNFLDNRLVMELPVDGVSALKITIDGTSDDKRSGEILELFRGLLSTNANSFGR